MRPNPFIRFVALLLVPGMAFGQLRTQGSELRDISESCILRSESPVRGIRGDLFSAQAMAPVGFRIGKHPKAAIQQDVGAAKLLEPVAPGTDMAADLGLEKNSPVSFDSLRAASREMFQPFQREPRLGVYLGGLDCRIFDLFPNLQVVHFLNNRPFRVRYTVSNLVYAPTLKGASYKGREALDLMKKDFVRNAKYSYIPDALQSRIQYGAYFLPRGRKKHLQIGMEVFIREELKQMGAHKIRSKKLRAEHVPTYVIDFVDHDGNARKIIYTQSDAYAAEYSHILETDLRGRQVDLFYSKAFTAKRSVDEYPTVPPLPDRLFRLKSGGLYVAEERPPDRGYGMESYPKLWKDCELIGSLGGKESPWQELGHISRPLEFHFQERALFVRRYSPAAPEPLIVEEIGAFVRTINPVLQRIMAKESQEYPRVCALAALVGEEMLKRHFDHAIHVQYKDAMIGNVTQAFLEIEAAGRLFYLSFAEGVLKMDDDLRRLRRSGDYDRFRQKYREKGLDREVFIEIREDRGAFYKARGMADITHYTPSYVLESLLLYKSVRVCVDELTSQVAVLENSMNANEPDGSPAAPANEGAVVPKLGSPDWPGQGGNKLNTPKSESDVGNGASLPAPASRPSSAAPLSNTAKGDGTIAAETPAAQAPARRQISASLRMVRQRLDNPMAGSGSRANRESRAAKDRSLSQTTVTQNPGADNSHAPTRKTVDRRLSWLLNLNADELLTAQKVMGVLVNLSMLEEWIIPALQQRIPLAMAHLRLGKALVRQSKSQEPGNVEGHFDGQSGLTMLDLRKTVETQVLWLLVPFSPPSSSVLAKRSEPGLGAAA